METNIQVVDTKYFTVTEKNGEECPGIEGENKKRKKLKRGK